MELKLPNKFDRSKLLVAYKLLNDLLFIEIVFFFITLLGEGLLPGSVSAHILFFNLLIVIGITILAIAYVGKIAAVELEEKTSRKIIFMLVFVLILLVIISLVKISACVALILDLGILMTGYYIYKITF